MTCTSEHPTKEDFEFKGEKCVQDATAAPFGPKILLVDDRVDNLQLLACLLKPLGVPIFSATSGREALNLMVSTEFAVVLLDIQMPDMDGFQVATEMKFTVLNVSTPVIFLTAQYGDEVDAFAAYNVGAIDFIRKPFHPYILQSKVKLFIELNLKTCHERMLVAEVRNSAAVISANLAHEKLIAETLQRAMLASIPPRIVAGYEIACCYEPALDEAMVGGDYYDAFLLDSNSLVLVVGDIMGKGLAAATQIADAKYSLRTLMRETGDPVVAMQRMNAHMCRVPVKRTVGASTTDTAGDPICAIIALLDRRTNKVRIATAGMDGIAVQTSVGEVLTFDPIGNPIGIVADARFGSIELSLEPGDRLLMFTDGITEARINGDLFGVDGVAAFIQLQASEDRSSLDLLLQGILDAAKRYAGGQLSDDSCLLAIARDRV